MKALSIGLLMLALTAPSIAQDARFVHDSGFRFYASPTTQVSQVNGEVAVLNGLDLVWIINNRFSVGLARHSLSNDIEADRPHPNGARNTVFFYSGITGAYSTWAAPRLQISASALIGGGEAHWREDDTGWDALLNRFERDEEHTTSLVVEPRIGASYMILPWLAVNASAGYRFVGGGKSNVLDQQDLNTPTGAIALRFGRF